MNNLKLIRDYKNEDIKNNQIIYLINEIKYEFIIKNKEAIISYTNPEYLEIAVKAFKSEFGYVDKIYNNDKSYYEEFDYTYLFKLPIKILQPSINIINKEYLELIKENYDYIPKIIKVCLIDDEYVIIKGHTLALEMLESGEKMVNVYLADTTNYIKDFVYIAKEYNMTDVTKLEILEKEQYDEIINQIHMMFNNK